MAPQTILTRIARKKCTGVNGCDVTVANPGKGILSMVKPFHPWRTKQRRQQNPHTSDIANQ